MVASMKNTIFKAISLICIATMCLLFIYILANGLELFNGNFSEIFNLYFQSVGLTVGVFYGVPLKPGTEKPKRLTSSERAELELSQNQKEMLIGLLLGDLYARICKGCVNARLEFIQGTTHTEYLLELYNIFKNVCSAAPKVSNPRPDKRTGVVNSFIRFNTLSLPCFNKFYDMFYLGGQKVVPQNIAELLTALALAHWIADDGSFHKSHRCVVLCTDSFKKSEVELLAQTLNDKWDLECSVNKGSSGYRIRIPARSLPILQSLCGAHMPTMMRHKIGL